MQRARLLGAAVVVVDEVGWSRVTVAHVCSRARVSRRTFYDLFEDREDCLLAVLQDTVGLIASELSGAGLDGLSWRERVRGGLWTILCFFDREPVLARVCVVGALQGGPRVLAWREEVLARLAGVLDQGRGSSARSRECTVLTAEGLVGAVFTIVYARLLASRRQEPLGKVLGELMSLIVLPYEGPALARAEQHRSLPLLPRTERAERKHTRDTATVGHDPLRDIPMRLTYRTARVLEVIGESPGASNRVVGESAGIVDQGQVSKLLARLERLGLLANTGEGHAKGEANAWTLTITGRRVTDRIGAYTDTHTHGEAVA
jgi:AcrR family transcriptional regulator